MMHWGYGFGGGIGMILWWVIVVGLIVAIIYGLGGLGRKNYNVPNQPPQSPLEILKSRYAKGEITKEEFREMKKELNNE
ncbi:MAG: putative rane protein [Clostridia bacterium]|jgi:putative membrane protein|nr:hypothetical protein [Clostridiales bacterium]MDK2985494.1 putative rane protein [Clostridia bacterium]